MPVDNSVATGIKTYGPADALDNIKKSMKAVGEAAGVMGRGMKTTENAMPTADVPPNVAFPNRGNAHK